MISGNTLPFEIEQTTLSAESSIEFWAWYPTILPEDPFSSELNWSGLGIKITTSGGTYTSMNGKPKRSSPTFPGKAYHFYTSLNGPYLQFTNSNGTPDTNTFMDIRDNSVY